MGRVKDQYYFPKEVVDELDALFRRTLPATYIGNLYEKHDLANFRYGQGAVNNSDTDYGDWIPYSAPCNHEWLDTGMRRTYCRHCNVRADRDAMTGQVTVLPQEEKSK